MNLLNINSYNLHNIDGINLILGKNGCGKSFLLKKIEQGVRSNKDFGAIRYLSPERGGLLRYDANVEHNINVNPDSLDQSRRGNQAETFRQQTMARFRKWELAFLRKMELDASLRQDLTVTFQKELDKINALLHHIRIERSTELFEFRRKRQIGQSVSDAPISPTEISSGEAELVSLCVECLVFLHECDKGKRNMLLIDEPDVHLHPDLQVQFAKFLLGLNLSETRLLLVATHSTALCGALCEDERARLVFMSYGQTDIRFEPISETYRRVLPAFGAHALSNVFNQSPLLLVEGDDDERVWQQAVRSASGGIKCYPCGVGGVQRLASFEMDADKILKSVYDNAIGFSIRDRDDSVGNMENLETIKRMRLACRNIENLLLTDEALAQAAIEWPVLETRISSWVESNSSHPHHGNMRTFQESGFDRMAADIKPVRSDLAGLMGTNKPWEVLVGKAIAGLVKVPGPAIGCSMRAFLGPEVCSSLIGIDPE